MGYKNWFDAYGDAFHDFLTRLVDGLTIYLIGSNPTAIDLQRSPLPLLKGSKRKFYNVLFSSTGRTDSFRAPGPISGAYASKDEHSGTYTYHINAADGSSVLTGFHLSDEPKVSISPADGQPDPTPTTTPQPNRTADPSPDDNSNPAFAPVFAIDPANGPSANPNAQPNPTPVASPRQPQPQQWHLMPQRCQIPFLTILTFLHQVKSLPLQLIRPLPPRHPLPLPPTKPALCPLAKRLVIW